MLLLLLPSSSSVLQLLCYLLFVRWCYHISRLFNFACLFSVVLGDSCEKDKALLVSLVPFVADIEIVSLIDVSGT